ncbi:kinase-like domain-containing protein [Tuber indicum]|nr:kinase-like domain-containing protein [Tuber indicum]
MDKPYSDLVVWYKLETEFFQDRVRHTRYLEKAKDRNRKVKEDWSNCGELGKGGFGVVNKQIQKLTGHCRAVKAIDKSLPHKFDYSRELLVMSILAKRPSLFVEFLGWFEDSETLYIAMEYIEGGDLTKHIGTPLRQETVRNISKQILEALEVMHQQGITHRDIKPANIFVVSMSPVWVKLGDFGISKRILAQDTTTLHTQVSTRVYGAPEVLGLDSDSETSEYTNSVDIWSLGCVGQVFRYYIGKFPFPEDRLKSLSPPTDDIGISFLESMLVIQPEDRPTAANALRHEWLMSVLSEDEDGWEGQGETTQGKDERTRNGKSENKTAAHDKQKQKRSEEIPITQDGTKCAPRDAALRDNPGSQKGSNPITRESAIVTFMITPPYKASIGGSLIQTDPPKSDLMSHNSQATRSKGLRHRGKHPIRNISQIRKNKRTTPQPLFLTKLQQELSISEPTLLGGAGSSQAIRRSQRTKSRGNPRRNPVVGEIAETNVSRPSIGRKILTPGESLILVGIRIAILMLAGIVTGILVLGRTPYRRKSICLTE